WRNRHLWLVCPGHLGPGSATLGKSSPRKEEVGCLAWCSPLMHGLLATIISFSSSTEAGAVESQFRKSWRRIALPCVLVILGSFLPTWRGVHFALYEDLVGSCVLTFSDRWRTSQIG